MTEQIPLARPELGPREEELLLEVVRSGSLSLGPKLEQFERDFSDWIGGGAYAVAVSSGTAALHLAVRAAGWGQGDEIVTSPLSFVASTNCLLYEGAKPVFADIDPVTLNLDPEKAAEAMGERTTGLLPVHIFGYPADLPAFARLAGDHDLRTDRGRLPGARRHRQLRQADRHGRQPRHLRLLRQQADDHG